jgi:hypothetical protein
MRRFAFVLATLFLALLARAEAADTAPSTFDTINRTDLMALMQQAGLTSVSDSTTDEASPWLLGRMANDFPVVVRLYSCEAGVTGPQRHCPYLSFSVTWNNTKNTDLAAVNGYNAQKVFGRGGISADGKTVYIDYAVNLEGGVTSDHIVKNIAYFLIAVNDFTTSVNL